MQIQLEKLDPPFKNFWLRHWLEISRILKKNYPVIEQRSFSFYFRDRSLCRTKFSACSVENFRCLGDILLTIGQGYLIFRQNFNNNWAKSYNIWTTFYDVWSKLLHIRSNFGKCFGQIRTSPNRFGEICSYPNLRGNTDVEFPPRFGQHWCAVFTYKVQNLRNLVGQIRCHFFRTAKGKL